jgi:hypothetical protein
MTLGFKVLKLVSGEDIVCKTDDAINLKDNFSIFIKDPLVLNQIRTRLTDAMMESYTLVPWFALAEEEFYEIPISNIITYATAKEELKENYIRYLIARKEAEENAIDVTDEIRDSILEENDDEKHDNGNSRSRRRKTFH